MGEVAINNPVDPNPRGESWAIQALHGLAGWVYRHPGWVLYPQVLLTVACLAYTILRLEFNTSRNDLVGANKKYHQHFLQFKKEFPQQDDLVVMVESEDMEKNRQFVERLGARLEAETNLFTDVFYKGDLKMMGPKAMLFLEETNLVELRDKLREYRPVIEKFSATDNLVSLFSLINRQFRTAKRETNAENDSLMRSLPALDRIITGAADSLRRPGIPPSPGVDAFLGAGQEAQKEMYITYNDGRMYLVNAHAAREDLNMKAVERLRELVGQTQGEVPGVNIGVTGEPVLEHDEMEQSQHDTMVATIVALIIVAFIFIYGYQETGRPVKATICLIVGLIYTLGFTTLTVGHLNILTITFLPMLIGLAIDFGVHLISRYEEELQHGRSMEEALRKATVYTGLGIVTGCFTTAGAFLAMGITNFKGIQEMGIISGGGLIICLIPMMTLLPVLLLRGRQNVLDHKLKVIDRRAVVEQLWLSRPKLVVALTLGLTLLALTQFPKVHFDYNLLNMQSKGLPAVIVEKKLINSASNSVLFGALVADSLPHAVELERRLTNLTTVASVKSMASYLASDTGNRLRLIGDIKNELATVRFPPGDTTPVKLRELNQVLWSFSGYLDLAEGELKKDGSEPDLLKQLSQIRAHVAEWRRLLDYGEAGIGGERLTAYQQALFRDISETFDALRNQDNSGPMRAEDLPAALRNRFVGITGKYLVAAFPKEDVWQRENQEAFVKELRGVDPTVTGTPVQLLEYTTLLKSSYEEAAYYALGAIAILVLLHFRSVSCVILSLLPVAVGAAWMVGLMGLAGIPFNPANIMTLPLVIGIGVTSGIQILNRFSEEQNPSIFARSTGLAVVVSALNTVAGFGSLILAKHQGIQSLGFVMAVGTTTCMLVAVTFLPAVLTLLMQRGWTLRSIKNPAP